MFVLRRLQCADEAEIDDAARILPVIDEGVLGCSARVSTKDSGACRHKAK
jgi:hypothetical protein